MMATTFWSVDGRPMSAAQFITRLFGDLPELFKDEDELRALWGQPDTRKALLESLSEKGYGDEQLSEIRRMIDAEKSDLFDVLAYIAFALSPITREERVNTHRRADIFPLRSQASGVSRFCPLPVRQGRRRRAGSSQTAALAGAEIQGRQRCGGRAWRRGADTRRLYRVSEAPL